MSGIHWYPLCYTMLLRVLLLGYSVGCVAGFRDANDGESISEDAPTVLIGREVIEGAAGRHLKRQANTLANQCSTTMFASWNYHTNLTSHNKAHLVAEQTEYQNLLRTSWEEAKKWKVLDHYLRDPSIIHKLNLLSHLGTSALAPTHRAMYESVIEDMLKVYRRASVCTLPPSSQCGINMDNGLDEIMSKSRDEDELRHLWISWRQQTKQVRSSYRLYIDLVNLAVRKNGHHSKAEMDLVEYGGVGFRDEMWKVWKQLEPLYTNLHAYVRRKLRGIYGVDVVSERGPIPAHLLGNMWGQSWDLGDILTPYPGQGYPDVTQFMRAQGYTVRKIFETANNFFTSMNMSSVPQSFWTDSLFEQPIDRPVICTPSAWDFCNGKDYRVKQCTRVNGMDMVSAHHELAHLQYFLQYKHLDYLYRRSPNPGVQEAVGLAIGLSAMSPGYLRRMALLPFDQQEKSNKKQADKIQADNIQSDKKQADINFLMTQALQHLSFLPFALLMEEWRWRVAEGSVKMKDWNCAWWDLRYTIQGVKPPVVRTEEDFDPGCKYHIAADLPYTGYFVALVLQYQLHKSLCVKSGRYEPFYKRKPLHKCYLFQSTEAGQALKSLMRLGRSVDWKEAVREVTGWPGNLDAASMREYFWPLEIWLSNDNARHGEYVGWRPDGEYCLYKNPGKLRTCKK